MQAPMTRRRLYTLVGGVAVLAGISWWRLGPQNGPPLPPRDAPPGELNLVGSGPRKPDVPSFSGKTMGTTYSVKYLPAHNGAAGLAEATSQAALDEVVNAMSTYEEKSEISLLNRSPADQTLPLSEAMVQVLTVAQEVHRLSGGAFDITVGPLVKAYGFGSGSAERLTDKRLEELGANVGMSLLKVDLKASTIQKNREGVELDLGGIAKGYGVDQVAAALEKQGVKNYLVEVGGELRVRGTKPGGQPWIVAIEEPTPTGRKVHGTLSLPKGGALATSGDYRNFREVNGRLVSHTFDPRTKKPVPRRTASVSVVRPTATEADAWATALSVLSPEEAIALATREDIPAYLLVHKDGGGYQALPSPAFAKLGFEEL